MNDVDERLGFWLAAAVEDPSTCAEMRHDILAWMEYHEDRGTLRDLAEKVERVARYHSCSSQAHQIIGNAVDHLCAVARVNEMNGLAIEELAEQFKRKYGVGK